LSSIFLIKILREKKERKNGFLREKIAVFWQKNSVYYSKNPRQNIDISAQ